MAESLFAFLEGTPYSNAAALLKDSAAQYEKWCDDVIMELAETARMQAFGSDPLAAYYIAKEAEIKNIRILSVCKEFGADKETITERMRKSPSLRMTLFSGTTRLLEIHSSAQADTVRSGSLWKTVRRHTLTA